MFLLFTILLQLPTVALGLNGGWSVWLPWGPCTSTPLGDVRSRARHCNNPAPSSLGRDCQGLQTEHSRCSTQTTASSPIDGAWSAWSAWGTCSATCNGGLQARTRTCSNPTPSQFGRLCQGTDVDKQACNNHNCPVTDGAWSAWSAWGACSATCNGGLQARTRTCSNPAPSQFGRPCQGTDVDKQLCNTQNCPGKQVAFSVYALKPTLIGTTPTFYYAAVNTGSFNMASGKFTCPTAGQYYFSFSFQHTSSSSGNPDCYFYVNGSQSVYARAYSSPYESASVSVIQHLSVNDVVSLYCSRDWQYVWTGRSSAVFSGFLISED